MKPTNGSRKSTARSPILPKSMADICNRSNATTGMPRVDTYSVLGHLAGKIKTAQLVPTRQD